MTEQELNQHIMQALADGRMKTIHQRTVRGMQAILRGEKWSDLEKKYEVTKGGISKAFKRIGLQIGKRNS